MARLRNDPRRDALTSARRGVLPSRLTQWFVNDWITDDERPRQAWSPGVSAGDSATQTDIAMARIMLSRRRFRAARAEWASLVHAQGFTTPPMPPVGQPRWRRDRIENPT